MIDFEINNILKECKLAKTPQEKSKIAENVIPILCEIHNKIIQGEYIKMVATVLDIDEEGLELEVKKQSRNSTSNTFTPKIESNVTKTSQIVEKAQKNLLSVYLIDGNQITLPQLSEMIPTTLFSEQMLIIVKSTIDKIIQTVNNVNDLRRDLFTKFIEDTETTQLLTELVYIAESYKGLDAEEIETAIGDMKRKICMLANEKETSLFKQKYNDVDDDDLESLKMQIALRDKLKNGEINE